MLTTMKGTTPEEIPVQVESLVDYSDGSLILFEALGPQIDAIGGIAAGMSGSPVYVEDGGVDKLIGAVSYGDSFTLNGLGLATPIEYMAEIEAAYPVRALSSFAKPRPPKAGVYQLSRPASGPGGKVTSVVVAPSVEAASRVDAAAAQTVMAPLGILEIGGAKPGSAAFEAAAAKLAGTGLLIKAAPGDGTWAGAPTPALEGGSPCAILFSQGAVWVGAAGTVTYVDGDTALLFGHPFEQLGAIDAALTGGNVEGVWASSLSPYKLISPQDVKGTCVQDRMWGVAARLDQQPDFFPVSTTVTGGRAPVSDVSSVSEWLVTSQVWPELPGDIAGEVALGALDQSSYPGSAETTTTVVVSDPTGTYTVEQDDLWTSSYNAAGLVGMDAGSIVWALVENPDGVLQTRIESVAVDAAISPLQRSARIVDVTLPNGIATGDNLVRIAYYRYGSDTLQTTGRHAHDPQGHGPLRASAGRAAIQRLLRGRDGRRVLRRLRHRTGGAAPDARRAGRGAELGTVEQRPAGLLHSHGRRRHGGLPLHVGGLGGRDRRANGLRLLELLRRLDERASTCRPARRRSPTAAPCDSRAWWRARSTSRSPSIVRMRMHRPRSWSTRCRRRPKTAPRSSRLWFPRSRRTRG